MTGMHEQAASRPEHHLKDVRPAWLVLCRVTCVCGWQSRLHYLPSVAVRRLFAHMACSAEEDLQL